MLAIESIESIIALAQKNQGWNFREYPPQRAILAGGCELIVLVPTLWRGYRCTPRRGPAQIVKLLRAANCR